MDGTTLKVIFLAFLQGLGEFFPISSSGHLVIFQYFLDLKGDMMTLDILLHGGTLLSLLIFFRKEILNVVKGLIQTPVSKWTHPGDSQIALMIVIASVPTALLGLSANHFLEKMFHTPHAAVMGFFITALILIFFHLDPFQIKMKPPEREFSILEALTLGVVQGLAVAPGISRSGTTIGALVGMGYPRPLAGRISFLLSIPAVGGALLLKLPKIFSLGIQGISPGQAAIGFFSSFLTGYLVLGLTMNLLSKGKSFFLFGYYCLFLGIGLTFWGVRYGF